ncbi:Acetyltransferase, GNAT family [Chitinophaga costaii]|uniref:Acetyltransferase, GNAT family n=1 Tax=Chitinophaga costaii TaxID=1335309 RepID=A0A1C3YWG1_9BACT|nr:GNAT family N-acetyltransferase [Chitinophaga costaii]PUZ30128.1 N-acetyltransferase [Chitinophaga costaii]SCB74358.1 Acetyltransferase, GNAT family [Chitinophaga costaii]
MNIVTAELAHLDVVAGLFDAYRAWYHQIPDLEGATAFVRERLQAKDSVILLAEDNGHFIGFTQLYPIFSSIRMRKAWLLNDLFLLEPHRGKGGGSLLLAAAHAMARASGAGWVMLQTDMVNTGAQALYERTGYRRDGHCYYYYLNL